MIEAGEFTVAAAWWAQVLGPHLDSKARARLEWAIYDWLAVTCIWSDFTVKTLPLVLGTDTHADLFRKLAQSEQVAITIPPGLCMRLDYGQVTVFRPQGPVVVLWPEEYICARCTRTGWIRPENQPFSPCTNCNPDALRVPLAPDS